MRSGFIPHWAKDENIGYKMINARAETVREKPSYRDAYASRRLIVPVSGFYEWKRDGAHKQPFAIRHPNQSPLPFAGLWGTWHDLDTFTIVTTEANAAMSTVHDRIPLILDDEQIEQWLDLESLDPADVLAAIPSEELELVPVTSHEQSTARRA
jgi:putative SOS response-associated peptidase YedK